MTCLPQDLSQSQLAALAIVPEAAPDYLSKLSPSTPINIPKRSSYLCDHPDPVAVHTLLTGISQRFKISYEGPCIPKEYSNLRSTKDNPSIISKNILKEVQLGHTAGPFTSPPFSNLQVYTYWDHSKQTLFWLAYYFSPFISQIPPNKCQCSY